MQEHFIVGTAAFEVLRAMTLRLVMAAVAIVCEPFLHIALSIFGDVGRCQHIDGGVESSLNFCLTIRWGETD